MCANNERLKMLRSFYAGCCCCCGGGGGGGADRDRLSVTIARCSGPAAATRDYSISPLNADN